MYCEGMNVDGSRSRRKWSIGVSSILQHFQSPIDGIVCRVQIRCARVRIDGIGNLVVARFVQAAEIVPNFRDIWVESDSSRVSVEGIAVLVDLIIEDTDRTPKCRIPTVSVDCLLIRFVGFVVALTSHERSTKKIPALRISPVFWKSSASVPCFGRCHAHPFRDSL